MNYREPNKDCPGCAGAGEAPSWVDIQQGQAKEGDRKCCSLCYNLSFRQVHEILQKMLEDYSGAQSKRIIPEVQEDIIRGEEGQRFRRLLKWLWENPEDSGLDRNGFPRDLKPSQRQKTTPFKQLMRGERRERKPKIKPLPEGREIHNLDPLFVVPVADFKKAWIEGTKAVKRSIPIPVLNFAKVTVELDSVRIVGTNLAEWSGIITPAFGFKSGYTFLVSAKLVRKILQSCDRKGDIAFCRNFAERGSVMDSIIIRHESINWDLVTLTPDNFPNEPEEKAEQKNEQTVAA